MNADVTFTDASDADRKHGHSEYDLSMLPAASMILKPPVVVSDSKSDNDDDDNDNDDDDIFADDYKPKYVRAAMPVTPASTLPVARPAEEDHDRSEAKGSTKKKRPAQAEPPKSIMDAFQQAQQSVREVVGAFSPENRLAEATASRSLSSSSSSSSSQPLEHERPLEQGNVLLRMLDEFTKLTLTSILGDNSDAPALSMMAEIDDQTDERVPVNIPILTHEEVSRLMRPAYPIETNVHTVVNPAACISGENCYLRTVYRHLAERSPLFDTTRTPPSDEKRIARQGRLVSLENIELLEPVPGIAYMSREEYEAMMNRSEVLRQPRFCIFCLRYIAAQQAVALTTTDAPIPRVKYQIVDRKTHTKSRQISLPVVSQWFGVVVDQPNGYKHEHCLMPNPENINCAIVAPIPLIMMDCLQVEFERGTFGKNVRFVDKMRYEPPTAVFRSGAVPFTRGA